MTMSDVGFFAAPHDAVMVRINDAVMFHSVPFIGAAAQVAGYLRRDTAILILLLLLTGCSRAQSTEKGDAFPTKPITYIIPQDPGGQSDRRARQQQPELERILKQKILIEN